MLLISGHGQSGFVVFWVSQTGFIGSIGFWVSGTAAEPVLLVFWDSGSKPFFGFPKPVFRCPQPVISFSQTGSFGFRNRLFRFPKPFFCFLGFRSWPNRFLGFPQGHQSGFYWFCVCFGLSSLFVVCWVVLIFVGYLFVFVVLGCCLCLVCFCCWFVFDRVC